MHSFLSGRKRLSQLRIQIRVAIKSIQCGVEAVAAAAGCDVKSGACRATVLRALIIGYYLEL
jgi:hypothetical protein